MTNSVIAVAPPASSGRVPEIADEADPETEPRVDVLGNQVSLRLRPDRGDPQLVCLGVGDTAVHASGDPRAVLEDRVNRVRPLDRVASLVQRAPRGAGPHLTDGGQVALVVRLVRAGGQVQRVL